MAKRIKRIPVRDISRKPGGKFSHKWLAGVLVLAAALIGTKKLTDYILNVELFQIAEVRLYGYARQNTLISEELNGLKKTNIFKADIKRLQKDLEAKLPEIKSATIYKRLPSRIDVEITPRRPLASIASWRSVLVDAEGFVYSPQDAGDYSQLPCITGIHFTKSAIKINRKNDALQLKRALMVLSLLQKFSLSREYPVSVVNISTYDNVKLSLKDGARVELGAGNYENKLNILKEVLGEIKQSGKKPRLIDLTEQEARITF